MPKFAPPGFTGSPLVRIDHERDHTDYFEEQRLNVSARFLRLTGLAPEVLEGGKLGWGSMSEADPDADLALLGLIDGAPHFAALVPINEDSSQRSAGISAALNLLAPDDAATYAIARGLVDWHARHPFCPRCAHKTRVFRSGWGRLCDKALGGCGAEHFPRTDPVVIMLAEYDDRVLLGRAKNWDSNRYSALAGFVEVGESIEEAVSRELFEEAGVVVREVRYVASQPWPFPSQLMIACIATVESPELTLQISEIEAAIWANRDEVRAALAKDPAAAFGVPPAFAIAHTLLTRWSAE